MSAVGVLVSLQRRRLVVALASLSARRHGEFVARMEDVLDLYHEDYDPIPTTGSSPTHTIRHEDLPNTLFTRKVNAKCLPPS